MHVRCHLDYGDLIYHDQLTESTNILERVQYNAALAITGCWKGTSKLKVFSELGWESLYNRRHCRRLCLFYKIICGLGPSHLHYNPNNNRTTSTNRYTSSFFSYCIDKWHQLPNHVKSSTSYSQFKKRIFHIYRPLKSCSFKSLDIKGLKFLTRLRCGFSDLREHRFHRNFNCISPVCACGLDNESTVHFILHCPKFSNHRFYLISNVINITNNFSITLLPDDALIRLLLYGLPNTKDLRNCNILHETITYILRTERFKSIEAYK